MEYTSIVQDVTFDRTFTSKKFCALFKTGIENYRKRTVLGAGIHIFTQLTGANALLCVRLASLSLTFDPNPGIQADFTYRESCDRQVWQKSTPS